MHTIALQLLLASVLGLSVLTAHGQVYGIGIHNGPMTTLRVDEHEWFLGSWPDRYGLLQFRSRSAEGAPWVTYTTICFGGTEFTVGLPAVLVIVIGLAAASSLVWLAIAAASRTPTRQRNERDDA